MKSRKAAAALLLAVTMLSLAGCADSSSEEVFEPIAFHTNPLRPSDSAAEQESETEEQSEMNGRLEAIYNLRPVPIPEGGWTDETLLPVVSVSGKPAELPFCLSELLFGYEPAEDGGNYYKTYADSFFGGDLVLHETALTVLKPHAKDGIPADAVPDYLNLGAKWYVITEDGKERYPISVNCVTIGSSYDEVAAQIGPAETGDGSGHFRAVCQSESIRITVSGDSGRVNHILLHSRNE